MICHRDDMPARSTCAAVWLTLERRLGESEPKGVGSRNGVISLIHGRIEWVTGVIILHIGLITLFITGRGPSCRWIYGKIKWQTFMAKCRLTESYEYGLISKIWRWVDIEKVLAVIQFLFHWTNVALMVWLCQGDMHSSSRIPVSVLLPTWNLQDYIAGHDGQNPPKQSHTRPKTKMTMEKQPFEHTCPIEKWWISSSC